MSSNPAEAIEVKNIGELIPYERNPKVHPESQIRQLANSIKQWGWTVPILVDEDNMVIAGHGRLYAAQELGMETAPCIVARGWSDKQKRAYVIADNKLAENGSWDVGLYYAELKHLAQQEFSLDLIGVDIDLSDLNYTPELNPITSYGEVEDGDMRLAADTLNASIERSHEDASNRATEVICPHCAKSFRFEGM